LNPGGVPTGSVWMCTRLSPRLAVPSYTRLSITHVIDFLPGITPYESTIVAEFVPSSDSVRMVLTLEPLHSDDFTKMSMRGWTSQLAKLNRRFGGRTKEAHPAGNAHG